MSPEQVLAAPASTAGNKGGWHRPPLLLYTYIINELLAPFFASFLILYGVFSLVQLIPMLDVVLSLGIGTADFIRLFAYIFPHTLLYLIPMASMGGVIVGFTRMTSDREILALKACGVSLWKMLPPVLCMAAAIATLTGYFSVRLIPVGDISLKQLMFQLAKDKIDKGVKAHEFTEALGDIVLYVDRIDDQKQWHGVYVSDMRDRQQPLITLAQSGQMVVGMDQRITITLNNGSLYNQDGQDNQVIHFNRYQLQIPLQMPTRVGSENINEHSRISMTQEELLQAARQQKPGSQAYRGFLSEYHYRLALPMGCFILSLLGMPLGLQAAPGRKAVGIPLGLAFFILYYICFTTTNIMVDDGTLPVVLGSWLTNIIFAVLTLVVFARVNREKPLVPTWITDRLLHLVDAFRPFFDKLGRLWGHQPPDRQE